MQARRFNTLILPEESRFCPALLAHKPCPNPSPDARERGFAFVGVTAMRRLPRRPTGRHQGPRSFFDGRLSKSVVPQPRCSMLPSTLVCHPEPAGDGSRPSLDQIKALRHISRHLPPTILRCRQCPAVLPQLAQRLGRLLQTLLEKMRRVTNTDPQVPLIAERRTRREHHRVALGQRIGKV